MATIDDLVRALMAAVESDTEIQIILRKTVPAKPRHEVTCPRCGWHQDYSRKDVAAMGLRRHFKRSHKREMAEELKELYQFVRDMHGEKR
jgi:hypothetical protein